MTFWKKKERIYKGKNFHYSLRKKLKREKKITDDFEVMLNTLTLEELIALKLELSVYAINNKMYNFPIISNMLYICKDACFKYALSSCRTKMEAARMLGMNEQQFTEAVRKYKAESYFIDEETNTTS